jgi:TonB family protein
MENRNQVRTRFVIFVLSSALLGIVSLQPSASCQETNQGEIKRKVTAKVQPKYPALARQLKLSGKVRVEVIVSPDGRVKSTRILGGNPLLADAALDAIRMWRYETGAKETTELVEIEFKDPNQ